MKIVVAPDSFKGALSSPQAAAAIADGLRRVFPDAVIARVPIADGGEGTLDALVTATGGTLLRETVIGPLGEATDAHWGRLPDGTAVIELAQAAGLTLVPSDRRDPNTATTYGLGQLIGRALDTDGVRRLIVGLGGSATNDGGAGMLQALGVQLRDSQGGAIPRGGAALARLTEVDASRQRRFSGPIWIACDVDNPLTGTRGASAVFGPQKGATHDDIVWLDAALENYAHVLGIDGGPGDGAAGGTAYGLRFLFPQAILRPGIDLVLDTVDFEGFLAGADLVLTGEGRIDGQTLGGKAVAGIARRAHAVGVPVAALVGGIGPDITGSQLAVAGIDAVLPLAPGPCALDDSIAHTEAWLADAAERAARWLRLGTCNLLNRQRT
jgi:glycerate kinase